MQALIAVLAVVLGSLVGYFLRQIYAKSEKLAAENEKAQLAQRAAGLSADVAALRTELAQVREIAERRAGFESLCAERQVVIDRLTGERDRGNAALQVKSDAERTLAARVSQLEADLRNERQNLADKVALLETAKETLASKFQSLAADILEQKSKTFAEASQRDLGNLLAPLQTQIKEFRERVDKVQTENVTGVTELKTLIGTLNSMNQQLTEEARNLTTALRGSAKAQGDWGEFILRDLLEKAGLREGEQYSFQQTFPSMEVDGERIKSPRTDVILSLPGGRHLVIDSKVSLNAYTDSVNAETEEARKAALAEHLRSVRKHINTLAKAGYHSLPGIESPDFVVLFIPIEPAFLLALQGDAALWADAYRQGILLVGPTTLLYVIRIVSVLWQQEMQARNVQEVMDRGSELYDKFVNFVSDLQAVGKNLRAADDCYGEAMKKLSTGRGNLIRQVEMLKQLGVKSSKSVPRALLDTADVEEPLALAAEAAEQPMAAE